MATITRARGPQEGGEGVEISQPTEDPEPVVDGDHHHVAVAGEDGAVVEVAGAPLEAVPVYEENDR